MGPVLLTQSDARNRQHAAAMAGDGIETLSWPLLAARPVVDTTPDLSDADALLITSANAIRVLAGLSPRRDLPVLCVGDTTAAAARELGFETVSSTGGTVADLAAAAIGSRHGQFMYPRGRDVSEDLGGLIGRHRVREAVVYAMEPGGPPGPEVAAQLESGRFAAISVWSTRNAEVLAGQLSAHEAWRVAATTLVAISAKTAEPLAESGFRATVFAPTPDTRGMYAAIRAVAAQ